MYYFDASALAKMLVLEVHSADLHACVVGRSEIITSHLAETELHRFAIARGIARDDVEMLLGWASEPRDGKAGCPKKCFDSLANT